MPELAKYFVPSDDVRFCGRERDVAEAFWKVGVFLGTDDNFIYERIREWESEGKALPASPHRFGFADMGLADSPLFDPVPNLIDDLTCPACGSDIMHAAYEVWDDEDSTTPLPERMVECPACHVASASRTLKSAETPFTFARFYLWVSEIDPEDWEGPHVQGHGGEHPRPL